MRANNPTSVALDIRNSAASGGGWTNVVASNGATYSYLYVGGNRPENNGAVTCGVGGGNAAITLNLTSDPRYRIQSVTFVDDPASQLSTHGNAPTMRVINDNCRAELDAQYKVTVLDNTANATIDCDPAITNRPQ